MIEAAYIMIAAGVIGQCREHGHSRWDSFWGGAFWPVAVGIALAEICRPYLVVDEESDK